MVASPAGGGPSAPPCELGGAAALADLARAATTGDVHTTARLARAMGLDRPDDPQALAIVRSLHRHHLVDTLSATLAAGGERPLADAIAHLHRRLRRRAPLSTAALLVVLAGLAEEFRRAGIPMVVLKGPVLAQRLYGGPDRRPQHDLDVLVPRSARRRAHRVLARLGFRRRARDRHGADYERGDARVDLHHALRAAPAYRINERDVWAQRTQIDVGGITLPTLADEHTLLLLALSGAEDAGHGMAKLKQLCDLWLLARELDRQWDWPAWFERRRRDRTLPVVVAGLTLALWALDAWDDTPVLRAALARTSAAPGIQSRPEALALLAAPRGSAANLAWFGAVYPGSLLAYRAHGILTGLPGSLRSLGPAWLSRQAALTKARRARPRRPPHAASADVDPRDGPAHH